MIFSGVLLITGCLLLIWVVTLLAQRAKLQGRIEWMERHHDRLDKQLSEERNKRYAIQRGLDKAAGGSQAVADLLKTINKGEYKG